MGAVANSHFHCPACGPLVFGRTRAICGRIIPPQTVGTGPERKCTDCKTALRTHKKKHH
jgi:hypothetical protein